MPRHKPTPELRAKVIELAGLAMPADTIARQVKLPLKVLQSAYAAELRDGRFLARGEAIKILREHSAAPGVAGANSARALALLLVKDDDDEIPPLPQDRTKPRVLIPTPPKRPAIVDLPALPRVAPALPAPSDVVLSASSEAEGPI